MCLQQEQLREEHGGHVHELQKKMKEQERNLEERQREDEEQVERTARENLELKHKQEKELEGTWVAMFWIELEGTWVGIVLSKNDSFIIYSPSCSYILLQ